MTILDYIAANTGEPSPGGMRIKTASARFTGMTSTAFWKYAPGASTRTAPGASPCS